MADEPVPWRQTIAAMLGVGALLLVLAALISFCGPKPVPGPVHASPVATVTPLPEPTPRPRPSIQPTHAPAPTPPADLPGGKG